MAGRPRIRGAEQVASDESLAAAACADPLRELGASNLLPQAARLAHGERAAWLYGAYDRLNRACWSGRLPLASIAVGITPHGCCVGLTNSTNKAPAILIHASLMDDWRQAACVLLHESIHVAIRYLYAGMPNPGESSHNCDLWARECNRIGRMIDLPEVCVRMTPQRCGKRIMRAPIQPTIEGVTMRHIGAWPHGLAKVAHGSAGLAAWQQRACAALGIDAPEI